MQTADGAPDLEIARGRGRRENVRVTSEGFSSERSMALLHLLDDDAPVVRVAVRAELERFPGAGAELLRGAKTDAAQIWLQELGWVDGEEVFLRFIRSLEYELETGWLLLDRVVDPSFDAGGCHLFLDQLANRVRELMVSPVTARDCCLVLNRVLFHEYGFRGARKDFDEPSNSFLHRVLERRCGLPITLSVIYLLVARQAGFELEPIGLPGRFMVGCFEDDEPFYVDVWAGGKFREADELKAFLKESGVGDDECFLLPVTVGETLCRGCRNLVAQYQEAGDRERAELFARFVCEFENVRRREANA